MKIINVQASVFLSILITVEYMKANGLMISEKVWVTSVFPLATLIWETIKRIRLMERGFTNG